MTLMYLDVDRFKQINDTYGHATGDALLRAFASRLMRCLRVSDTVARLGGDEFAVLLERLPTKDQAAMIAEKILRSMSEPFLIEERRIHMTTSIGLVHYRGEETTPESLIKLADEGMYLAKTAGGNNWKSVAIA
jgi:diguanylate cyclase (GGDEF)-like protein